MQNKIRFLLVANRIFKYEYAEILDVTVDTTVEMGNELKKKDRSLFRYNFWNRLHTRTHLFFPIKNGQCKMRIRRPNVCNSFPVVWMECTDFNRWKCEKIIVENKTRHTENRSNTYVFIYISGFECCQFVTSNWLSAFIVNYRNSQLPARNNDFYSFLVKN